MWISRSCLAELSLSDFMDFDEYQKETAKTAIYPKEREDEYLALGLASEAGEYAGRVKKTIRDRGGIIGESEREARKYELGDVMWYIARSADQLGYSLEEIAVANIEKLRERQRKGTINGSGDNR